MRHVTKVLLCLLPLCVLSLAGCRQKVNEVKEVRLNLGDVKMFSVDPFNGQHNVTVSVASDKVPIDLFVVTESNHAAVLDALTKENAPDPAKVMASKLRIETGALDLTIPAKTGFTVFLSGARKGEAQVLLKITSK